MPLPTVKHPNDVSQHVATRLYTLSLTRRLKLITGASAKAQVYSKFQDYLKDAWVQLNNWANRHHVSGIKAEDWKPFLTKQWLLQYPESQSLLSMQDVKYIISVVPRFVAHGRDHAPNDLHLSCPRFYWQVWKNMFGDPKVYLPCRSFAFSSCHVCTTNGVWLLLYAHVMFC